MTFDVSNDEIDEIKQHKSMELLQDNPYYANKFYISFRQDGSVRLSFFDTDNYSEKIRCSVVMTIHSFKSLEMLINDAKTFEGKNVNKSEQKE